MLKELIVIFIGVIAILFLADLILKKSLSLANHFGVSGTFIGLTILSIGTSIPEIMTHIIGSIKILNDPSSMQTMSGILLGTNIGSDIFQESFVLPLVGLVGVIVVKRKNLISEMGAMIAAATLVLIFAASGTISRVEGGIMLLLYLCYLLYLEQSGIGGSPKAKNNLSKLGVFLASLTIIACFGAMAFVADNILESAKVLVTQLPVSASFLGVVLLGVASALPELTTSLIAVLKGQKEVSAGILIGSNVTNPLMGIGLGALISSYTVPSVTIFYDLPGKIIIASIIFIFLWRHEDLKKWEAVSLILIFIAFLFVRMQLFPADVFV